MGKVVSSHSFPTVVSNGEILSVLSALRIHHICLAYSNVKSETVTREKNAILEILSMQFL